MVKTIDDPVALLLLERIKNDANRKARNEEGQFKKVTLEQRVEYLEQRVRSLDKRNCLLDGVDIPTNIQRWFRSHFILATIQFTYELMMLNQGYTASSIRAAIWRMEQRGHLVRLKHGLYIEAD